MQVPGTFVQYVIEHKHFVADGPEGAQFRFQLFAALRFHLYLHELLAVTERQTRRFARLQTQVPQQHQPAQYVVHAGRNVSALGVGRVLHEIFFNPRGPAVLGVKHDAGFFAPAAFVSHHEGALGTQIRSLQRRVIVVHTEQAADKTARFDV